MCKIVAFDEIKEITLPTGVISATGIHEIERNILENRLPYLPDDWKWVAKTTGKGEYVGTFCKRLSKYYHQQYKIKLTSSFLGKIGSIVGQHAPSSTKYRIDITDTFNWIDGDYGDEGSCYWGGRSIAREVMQDQGCFAIRFYDEDDNGIGRAWIAPIEGDKEEHYIVFNSYGIDLSQAAQVLAKHLQNTGYKKINLVNNGQTQGYLWINAGGYFIGPPDVYSYEDTVDLCYTEDIMMCQCCERFTYTDGCYEDYCEDCMEDRDICSHCGNIFSLDDITVVNDIDSVCNDCLEDEYTPCHSCNEYVLNDDVMYVDDYPYCQDCGESEEERLEEERLEEERLEKEKLKEKDKQLTEV
jgi:hypothetical protein